MQSPKTLLEYEDNWVTDMGSGVGLQGRVVFRGKDLFHDLKDLKWMALLLYGITGRIPNEKQIKLFEGIWVLCVSYPEPRIWTNRIASLAGTTRSTTATAAGAATAIFEASMYGSRAILRTADFLFRAKEKLDDGIDLAEVVKLEIKQYKYVSGYGRPAIHFKDGQDERVEPLMSLAKELGFADGAYVDLAFSVKNILLKDRPLLMNIAVIIAALALEQGFSRNELYQYTVSCFTAGMFPCYIDTQAKPEGSFFPLRCNKIKYEGKQRRVWNP